jgi:hypothetical protein
MAIAPQNVLLALLPGPLLADIIHGRRDAAWKCCHLAAMLLMTTTMMQMMMVQIIVPPFRYM